MGFRLTAHFAAGLLFLIPGHLVSAQTIGQDIPAITIFVYNTAHVSQSDLARSEQEASMIFRETGIPTKWIDCSTSPPQVCHQPLGAHQFVLHIVPSGKTSTDAVMGVAFLGPDGIGRYSDVFFTRIEQMHRDSGASTARLLGSVAAHEIGHLLLGSHSHSATGIMSARWNKQELQRIDRGYLRFTSEQAARMRSRLAGDDGLELAGADNVRYASTGTK